jgi:hypothetical protein
VQSHRHPRNLAYAYPSPFEQDFTLFSSRCSPVQSPNFIPCASGNSLE